MEIIRTNNLTKIYGKGEASIAAVNNLSFSIDRGSFVSIVGESGSGKSTLLNLLGGVDAPTEGEVYIDGENIYELNDNRRAVLRRRKIGFVFQSYNLIPVLSVEENIKIPLLIDGKKVEQDKIDEILNRLNLYDRRSYLPNQLSGGQQQRVAIGRALSNAPDIIIADEPTGNLDKKNSEEVIELLSMCAGTGGHTLILVTHAPDIAAMADRIIELSDGCIISDTGMSLSDKSTFL